MTSILNTSFWAQLNSPTVPHCSTHSDWFVNLQACTPDTLLARPKVLKRFKETVRFSPHCILDAFNTKVNSRPLTEDEGWFMEVLTTIVPAATATSTNSIITLSFNPS